MALELSPNEWEERPSRSNMMVPPSFARREELSPRMEVRCRGRRHPQCWGRRQPWGPSYCVARCEPEHGVDDNGKYHTAEDAGRGTLGINHNQCE